MAGILFGRSLEKISQVGVNLDHGGGLVSAVPGGSLKRYWQFDRVMFAF